MNNVIQCLCVLYGQFFTLFIIPKYLSWAYFLLKEKNYNIWIKYCIACVFSLIWDLLFFFYQHWVMHFKMAKFQGDATNNWQILHPFFKMRNSLPVNKGKCASLFSGLSKIWYLMYTILNGIILKLVQFSLKWWVKHYSHFSIRFITAR